MLLESSLTTPPSIRIYKTLPKINIFYTKSKK
nr:MAG TPA: hypothetical protein [Caudoviricetes sp.]